MVYENNGELVLSAEETVALLHNMFHPNVEANMRRDEFLRDLSDLHIDLTNGEITANCPEGFNKEKVMPNDRYQC